MSGPMILKPTDPRTVTLERDLWAALLQLVDKHAAELPRDRVVNVRCALLGAVKLESRL